jgi:quinol monooxygenase YgiN
MPELQAIAHYVITAGRQDEVLSLLVELAEASRGEPDNIAFDVYRKAGDDRDVVLLERYRSREAFAAHRDTPHFQKYVVERIIPLLDSRTIELFDVEESDR